MSTKPTHPKAIIPVVCGALILFSTACRQLNKYGGTLSQLCGCGITIEEENGISNKSIENQSYKSFCHAQKGKLKKNDIPPLPIGPKTSKNAPWKKL